MPKIEPRDRIKWANSVRRDVRLRPSDRLVAAEIANHADQDGIAYPGKARLAALLGMSEKTVQRATAALASFGYIKKSQGTHRSNDYRLLFPRPVRGGGVDTCVQDGGVAVHRGGQGSPTSPDSSEPQTCYTEPSETTCGGSLASPPSTGSDDKKKVGLEEKKSRRARYVASRSPNRGRYELELGELLGDDAFEVLSKVPKCTLEVLLRRVAERSIGEVHLQRARRLAALQPDY